MSPADQPLLGLCPEWCRREHDPEERSVEEDHTAETCWVPVVVLQRDWEQTPRALDLLSTELVIGIRQPDDSSEPWISIEESEGSLVQVELSVSSAQRLAAAIWTSCCDFTLRSSTVAGHQHGLVYNRGQRLLSAPVASLAQALPEAMPNILQETGVSIRRQ